MLLCNVIEIYMWFIECTSSSRRISESVSWFFKPSQSKRIISGLKKTFINRYIVERTNKAEIRPKEQREKAESCRENL